MLQVSKHQQRHIPQMSERDWETLVGFLDVMFEVLTNDFFNQNVDFLVVGVAVVVGGWVDFGGAVS